MHMSLALGYHFDEHRQDRDAENADGVAAHSDGEEKPFTLGETLQNPRREDLKKTSEIRHEGQDTDLGFIESVLQQEARIKETA